MTYLGGFQISLVIRRVALTRLAEIRVLLFRLLRLPFDLSIATLVMFFGRTNGLLHSLIYQHWHVCGFRNHGDMPWMPLGQLRDQLFGLR